MIWESYLTLLKQYSAYITITVFTWLSYFYTLRCGSVSDDIAGLLEYDGSLRYPVLDDKEQPVKNPDGSIKTYLRLEYGTLWRWLRFHIVGGLMPSGKKNPDGSDVPQGKFPIRAHFLSVVIFNLTCLVTFIALKPIIGEQNALLSILILIAHPCTTQGVAWVSGLAYPLSLLWISVSLILMQFFYAHQTLNNAIWVIPVFCIVQFMAIHAIFATTAMIWALLLFLGYWQFSAIAFLLASVMCFDQIRKTVVLRVEEFKKQHMAESTTLNWSKHVVMMKTLWYYLCHSILPLRLGLYHEWGFHYTKELERRDWRFWLGFFSFCIMSVIFFKTDMIGIKLGILWYIVFSIGFWNLITAQQFVTERYIMVANLGLGIIITTLTYNYFWLYTLILGLYLCKTWTYLPTYDNELRFYQSNHWNFPKSEVALGNLGVTYARIGLENSAKDHWMIATQINSEYDVPYVNIFYQYRTKGVLAINNGDYIGGMQKLQEGLPFLEKAMSCKVCHFPEQWKKEYSEVLNSLRQPWIMLQQELDRLLQLKRDLKTRLSRSQDAKDIQGINESLINNETQMDRLIDYFKANKYPCTNPGPFNQYYTDKMLYNLTRRQ